MICESKQLKKLAAISSSLKTIANVIYFEDDEAANVSGLSGSMSDWKVSSFHDVEKLGKRAPIPPSLPSKDGVAVIMYTSGSTGLPKVCSLSFMFSILFISTSLGPIENNTSQWPQWNGRDHGFIFLYWLHILKENVDCCISLHDRLE